MKLIFLSALFINAILSFYDEDSFDYYDVPPSTFDWLKHQTIQEPGPQNAEFPATTATLTKQHTEGLTTEGHTDG